MKRLLCILSLLIPALAMADTVSESTARKVAEGFFGNPGTKSGTSVKLVNAAATKAVSAQDIYIYDRQGGGFVGIAGDDALSPIMFYSTTGEFVLEGIPENIQCVIDDLAGCVQHARKIKMTQTSAVASEWSKVQKGISPVTAKGEGGKYLQTPNYDQDSPYWDDCPTYQGYNCYSGCVATATAEIMKFHEWPEAGVGTIPAYRTDEFQIDIPARELGHKYDWENILPYYNYYKGQPDSGTDEQRANVAELLFDIGCMVAMDYGPDGSGAVTSDAAIGLATYMGYCGDIYHKNKDVYSRNDWIAMIKESIDNGLPVLYSGRNSGNGGHAFVADGYDEDGNIHINFGWSGIDNAYYTFPIFDSYSLSHSATFNIRPNKNGSPDTKITEVFIYGLSASVEKPVRNQSFNVTIDNLEFSGNTNLETHLALYRVDGGGNPVEQLSKSYTKVSLNINYYYPTYSLRNVSFSGEAALSDVIKLFYNPFGSDEWVPVLCNTEDYGPDSIPLGTQADFEAGTIASFDKGTGILKVSSDKYTRYTLTKSDKAVDANAYSVSDGVLSIDTSKLSGGTYKVKAAVSGFSKEFSFVL